MSENEILDNITNLIYRIRGQKVMLDFDLAILYGIETRALKRQVRSNVDRFPGDFMFKLNKKEWYELVQNLHKLGNIKYTPSLPFAFTVPGVAMLSSVLRSKQAVQVNIKIMRTFIELRNNIINYEDLLKKLERIELGANEKLFKHDNEIKTIFEIIEKMTKEEQNDNRQIGFNTDF